MNKLTALLTVAALSVALSGCGSAGQTGANQPAEGASSGNPPATNTATTPPKPVTLQVLKGQSSLTEDQFKDQIADPVNKKYPYITMKFVTGKYEDLLTSGDFPDMVYTGMRDLTKLSDLDIPVDLTALMKQNKLAPETYKEQGLDAAKRYSPKNQIIALPLTLGYYVMYYNKNIFDKFGVSYPADGMTWDDVAVLAKKVSHQESGTSYRGVDFGNASLIGRGLSLPYIDPKTNRSLMNSDGWKKVYSTAYNLLTVPGNERPEKFNLLDSFYKDQTLAMLPYYGSQLTRLNDMAEAGTPMNWDMVTWPSFTESKGTSAETDVNVLVLTKPGKHQQEAFQVMQYLTSSKEVQETYLKMTLLPAINMNAQDETKLFGQDLGVLKGKNIQAVFASKLRLLHEVMPYDEQVRSIVDKYFTQLASGKITDVNTTLRQAEEEMNRKIDELQAQNKK